MRQATRYWIVLSLVFFLAITSVLSGCNAGNPLTKSNQSGTVTKLNSSPKLQVNGIETIPAIPLIQRNGIPMIQLTQMVQSLDMQSDQVDNRIIVGFTGEEFSIVPGANQATVGDQKISLAQPVTTINGKNYVSLPDAETLFQVKASLDPATNTLSIRSKEPSTTIQSVQTLALKNVNENRVISYAKLFLGVPYKFGTGPYQQTRRFDCSSFTQYVFKKFGVDLPRNSRQQAKVGQRVSYNNMKKGDLVFFYVPGRFKTNRTVGHVGIYMGNGKMIQTYDGVKIINIRKPYWKKTFLEARRYFR